MTFCPVNSEIKSSAENMTKGNFGLWYNKFIPLNNERECKPCDSKGNEKNPVEFYVTQYKKLSAGNSVSELLKKKHEEQMNFCSAFSSKYKIISIKAELKTSLVTGIGESHPHEISMVFDRNIGIPYIPASGVKGIARFALSLSLLEEHFNGATQLKIDKDKNGNEFFNDEEHEKIKKIFGNQEKRGDVIFLDAYPVITPLLKEDIMNPHYAEYYSNKEAPADNQNPTPIKFLTVAPSTTFIFRAIAKKDFETDVINVLTRALTKEGVGAKTAIGYGLFENLESVENTNFEDLLKEAEEISKKAEIAKKLESPPQRSQQNTHGGREQGKRYRDNKVLPSAFTASSSTGLKTGDVVIGILLAEKTKTEKWKVKCKDDEEISGAVMNSDMIVGKNPGDEIQVKLENVNGRNTNFKVV